MIFLNSLLPLVYVITIITFIFFIYKKIINKSYVNEIKSKNIYNFIRNEIKRERLPKILFGIFIFFLVLSIIYIIYSMSVILEVLGSLFVVVILFMLIITIPFIKTALNEIESYSVAFVSTVKYYIAITCLEIEALLLRSMYIDEKAIKILKEYEYYIKNDKFIIGSKRENKNNRINIKKNQYELFEISNNDIIPIRSFYKTDYVRVTIINIKDNDYLLTTDDLKLLNIFLNQKTLYNAKENIIKGIIELSSLTINKDNLSINNIEIDKITSNIQCSVAVNIDNNYYSFIVDFKDNNLIGIEKKN